MELHSSQLKPRVDPQLCHGMAGQSAHSKSPFKALQTLPQLYRRQPRTSSPPLTHHRDSAHIPVPVTERATIPSGPFHLLVPLTWNVLSPQTHRAHLSPPSFSGVWSKITLERGLSSSLHLCSFLLHITCLHLKHCGFRIYQWSPHDNISIPRAGTVVLCAALYPKAHSRCPVNIY